ncbi:MAG: nucleoside hydrolase [Candidatus Electronema sp. V4]|uniref:nucleoside hydrolase n=1 Tax=Candidatus Electronema sp. V4 TaxID=3454756 RepID=UPI0040558003
MRAAAALTLVFVLWTMMLTGCGRETGAKPPLLILDTDFASDADDVGAAAVLHNLATQGKVNILAMMVSSGNPWSVPCLQAVNAWFRRPEIPVGKAADGAVQDESAYTRAVAEAFSRHPAAVPDAVQLYRRTLAAQPDQSVTIVSVGYLTNLRNLLQSKPDAVSPLDGQELVRRKTARLVCMGGQYPSGREWNFHRDVEAAAYVAAHWPTPIVFAGFELGKDIVTGTVLRRLPENNPVRRSYELHNKLAGRPSWDQIAVYYAVMTADDSRSEFWTEKQGSNVVAEDGSNRWLHDQNGHQAYLVQRGDAAEITARLEQLMLPAQL